MDFYKILMGGVGVGMSNFDRLFAEKHGGGGSIQKITGTLPLTFKTSSDALIDYKIYGNTVDGEGVGVETENVMPAGEQKTVVSNGVTFSSDGKGKYTINGTATTDASAQFNLLSAFTTPISVSNGGQGTLSFFNTSADYNVSIVFCNGATMVDSWRMYQIRRTSTTYNILGNKYVDSVTFTVGSGVTVDMTITPEFTNDGIIHSEFEPYGYKLPMISRTENVPYHRTETPIYIGDAQLMQGEYVRYSKQKIYKKVNGTLTPTDPPVSLPELPTFTDTNTVIDYEETPAPEEVELTYKP